MFLYHTLYKLTLRYHKCACHYLEEGAHSESFVELSCKKVRGRGSTYPRGRKRKTELGCVLDEDGEFLVPSSFPLPSCLPRISYSISCTFKQFYTHMRMHTHIHTHSQMKTVLPEYAQAAFLLVTRQPEVEVAVVRCQLVLLSQLDLGGRRRRNSTVSTFRGSFIKGKKSEMLIN